MRADRANFIAAVHAREHDDAQQKMAIE